MMGFKRFYLIDMDTIELGNVTRQVLYSHMDIGNYKVVIVQKQLKNRWNDVFCSIHTGSFDTADSSILSTLDVIIGCVDNLETREAINSFALKESIVYLDGGSTGLGGQVQVVVPGVSLLSLVSLDHSLLSLSGLSISY